MEDQDCGLETLGSLKCALNDIHLVCCEPVELKCGDLPSQLACSACARDQTDYLGNYVCQRCHQEHQLVMTNLAETKKRYDREVTNQLTALSRRLLGLGNRLFETVEG